MPLQTVCPDLEETLALSDHVRQALRSRQVLVQVLLVRPTCGVLPLDRPAAFHLAEKYISRNVLD